jgi:UDP-N-acetylglucosamine 3-dehydrogenase
MADSAARGTEPLRVGVVGLGEVGQHHLLGYLSTERARVVAVADLSADLTAAAAAKTGARIYPGWTELLSDPDVEAVDVSLPHDLHLAVTTAALEAGRHVLVEKPMGLTVGECDRMIDSARRADRVLAVSHNQVFFAPHVAAVDLVRSGAIGRPTMVRLRLGVGGRYPGWRLDPAKAGGGLLYDAGVHRFYMAREIMGEPVAVAAQTDVALPGLESEGTGVVLLDFGEGRFGVIDANYLNPPRTFDDRIEVAGDAGLVALAGCEAAFEGFTSDPPLRVWAEGGWSVVDTPAMDWSGSVQAAVRDFVDAVLDGRRPKVAGEDGRAVVAMIQAAYESARTGRRVELGEMLGAAVTAEAGA